MKDNHTLDLATAPKRDSLHWKQETVTWGALRNWMDAPADKKEAGNYVLGRLTTSTRHHRRNGTLQECTNLHRDKAATLDRCALSLDIDSPAAGFADGVAMVLPWAALLHTTYSSAPDAPRYRLLIPLSRRVHPDEYHALAHVVMQRLGEEQFDPGSDEAWRYMFRPAAQEAAWWQWWEVQGDPAPVDELLADWDPDLSTKAMPRPHRNKRDPYSIPGTVGAFNSAYEDLAALVEAYDLPYVEASTDRWQLVGARSVAGMGQVQDAAGLYYSHHVSDPAYGRTCSAFDLVRLHRFGSLDEGKSPQTPINKLPSHDAMLELAVQDPRVKAKLAADRDPNADFDKIAEEEDFDAIGAAVDWRLSLRLNKNGDVVDHISNWDLITKHEAAFQGLYYNELSMAVESREDLPWRPLSRGGAVFTSTDRAALALQLERTYGVRLPRQYLDELINTRAQQKFVNPVRDYLESLEWDGTPRVETCLPGVVPTTWTRNVARKVMTAAVARMLRPGIKWDHTLVLFGSEGLGKSHWVDRMSRGYSASLGRIGDKDTLLAMQRSWIMTSDEGYSLRKADADVQKEFLTRTEDVFRRPYEREAMVHKRHCVIWGTTNDQVFLRRQEGNRRFLIVHCESKVDFDSLTDQYVDQVWAEAVHMWRRGERLFLLDEESAVAAKEREAFTEEDVLVGLLQEHLDTLVPEDWYELSPEARVSWLQSRSDGLVRAGTMQQDRTCSLQLWVEAMGRRQGDQRRVDLLEINTALKHLPEWEAVGQGRIPGYGSQLVFKRHDPDQNLI